MQLRIVTVPSASPERSAGYDASLGCPGAGPLLPGVPAIGPTSPGRSSRGQNRWTLRRQAFRRTTARDCTRQPRRARQLHRPTAGALAPSTFGDAEGGTRLLGQGVLSTVGGGGGGGGKGGYSRLFWPVGLSPFDSGRGNCAPDGRRHTHMSSSDAEFQRKQPAGGQPLPKFLYAAKSRFSTPIGGPR